MEQNYQFGKLTLPTLKKELRLEELSHKESKLIKILDFVEIEQFIYNTHITNIQKDRIQIARAFIAKSAYNLQTTRDLVDRLHCDRTLRLICGWRYKSDIPSEAKFSRVFKVIAYQIKIVFGRFLLSYGCKRAGG